MKELIEILETAQSKHGGTSPLTIGHLLNICKLAEKLYEKEIAKSQEIEIKSHLEIIEDINPLGQD